jgi:hypothetical protein
MPTLSYYPYDTEQKSLSTPQFLENLSNEAILAEFSALYDAIVVHVKIFYTTKTVSSVRATQVMIEQASTGVLLPWPQILDLLDDEKTRLGILAMCIGRTMLSRSLLLGLGISNNPGATFLPPEIVDCFQSFCMGKSAATLDGRETKPIDYALLSRWKQLSATLLHSTYVADAFSSFDGRTVNIERAMMDLGPLLATYAIPKDAGRKTGARLGDLREVLRKGARLAFTLFSQPCFWTFDWYSDREIETREGQRKPSNTDIVEDSAICSKNMHITFSLTDIVIWPCLRRVVNQDGRRLEGEGDGIVFGKKKYLAQVLK